MMTAAAYLLVGAMCAEVVYRGHREGRLSARDAVLAYFVAVALWPAVLVRMLAR